jgi:ribosome biogenesis protein MAK21
MYYAIITLNQMVLSHHPKHGAPVATKLVDIYFTLFRLVLDRRVGVAAERARAQADGTERAQGKGDSKRRPPTAGKAVGKAGKHAGKGGPGGRGGAAAAAPPKAEEVDARMLAALIAGVRRAHPYVDAAALQRVFSTHADALFRTVHIAPLTVSVQALMLLFQVPLSPPVPALPPPLHTPLHVATARCSADAHATSRSLLHACMPVL